MVLDIKFIVVNDNNKGFFERFPQLKIDLEPAVMGITKLQ
jgi:hypothetical protein